MAKRLSELADEIEYKLKKAKYLYNLTCYTATENYNAINKTASGITTEVGTVEIFE